MINAVYCLIVLSFYLTCASCEVNGSNYAIVVDHAESEQVKGAAQTLQKYILLSTGLNVPIVDELIPERMSIHLGNTSYVRSKGIATEGIDDDGFIFNSDGYNHFIILGGSDWGTEFGVYTFLEEYLGVRWLMPTELGVDVPKRKRMEMGRVDKKYSPAYLSRHLSPIDINQDDELAIWARFNKVRKRVETNHNLNNLFDVGRYGITNPDFYPYIRGEIRLPTSKDDYQWQPNFFAAGLADSAIHAIQGFFEKNPNSLSFSLSINDDASGFDRSPLSLKKRNRKHNYLGLVDLSEEYFLWANQVVSEVNKSYPDKLYGTLAYNNLITPPTDIEVEKNIIPFITSERLRWSSDAFKNRDIRLTKEWQKTAESVGWYDYVYGRAYLVPRVWNDTMAEYLRWGAQNGINYYAAELYPNWGEGPKAYLLTKLLWDPTLDHQVILDDWYVRFAGAEAAPILKKYFALWEEFWTNEIQKSPWFKINSIYLDFTDLSYLSSITTFHIETSDNLLKEAYILADTDRRKDRVRALENMWNLYKAAIQFYHENKNEVRNIEDLKRSQVFIEHIDRLRHDPLYERPIAYLRKYLKYK